MSLTYIAPIQDMQFILSRVLRLGKQPDIQLETELSEDLINAVLGEMGKYCERVLLPLNASGDEQGCVLIDGKVVTPGGFAQAYKTFISDGWASMSYPTELGGQGLPHVLHAAVSEMISAVNPGFSMYTGMNKGAIIALCSGGNEKLRDIYLANLVSGQWTATMNLTEPQAGTDLGLLRTKAVMQSDGSYRITGNKIFISGGDHDLTENIIHLVLARTPSSPPGSKGISLFLVPKYLVDSDGSVGKRNTAICTGLEKKMGIRSSATCSMSFDDAQGYLIGEENAGLKAMFHMMNTMRIAVGGQSIGLADIALQSATDYCKQRLQGRSPTSKSPPNVPDPIIEIPDVRRMLLSSRAFVEGGRALVLWISNQLDTAEHGKDAVTRLTADKKLALLTPVVKGFLTEVGEEAISMSLQCYGGHGYITETGIEQVYRDARITKLYEGATGVQALDLLGRKVLKDGGKNLSEFIAEVQLTSNQCSDYIELAEYKGATDRALDELARSVKWIMENVQRDPSLVGSVSHYFLRLMGLVVLGYMWCLMGLAVCELIRKGEDDRAFLKAKLRVGDFYMRIYLPEAKSLTEKIMVGSEVVIEGGDALL